MIKNPLIVGVDVNVLLSQLVNLPEPVTLDFLDAEVEDSNKEEVIPTVTGKSLFSSFSFPCLSRNSY